MTIEAFLKSGWSDHGDRPQEVADRMAESLHLVQAPENCSPFVGLLTHVYGEHLGLWHRGVELLEELRDLPALNGSSIAAGAISRGIGTLRYAGGEAGALEGLSEEDRVRALATASSALAARQDYARAIDAFDRALQVAQAGLPSGSLGIRALAAHGNNLAVELERKRDRDAHETTAMIRSAEAALSHWKLAGTWLEEERAEYRLARSLLQAERPQVACESANRCLALCESQDAPPFEKFFAHAVVALAERELGNTASFESHLGLAKAYLEQIPQAERQWCEDDLRELEA